MPLQFLDELKGNDRKNNERERKGDIDRGMSGDGNSFESNSKAPYRANTDLQQLPEGNR